MDSGLALALLDLAVAVGRWRLAEGDVVWRRRALERVVERAFDRVLSSG